MKKADLTKGVVLISSSSEGITDKNDESLIISEVKKNDGLSKKPKSILSKLRKSFTNHEGFIVHE